MPHPEPRVDGPRFGSTLELHFCASCTTQHLISKDAKVILSSHLVLMKLVKQEMA
ncbi:unnamed protein product [Miscanthus lutarioriparius]|uniref:Uncharacterized protein n=1 Tax=Miscanthus lutarioriparius TaxID=422564 RepID=A0A811R674_9POAL|nr:unnamed protein product [Miscanthus lutarioriparius]